MSAVAERHRQNRLCPFNNRVANCTKDKANDPLGVCSIIEQGAAVITCPVRFRQDWIIATDAANFFFQESKWTTLTEVKLKDRQGKSAGNIDVVVFCDVQPKCDCDAGSEQGIYCENSRAVARPAITPRCS